MSQSITSLGPRMTARLGKLEVRIEDGLSAFIDVGKALKEIREQRLYKQHYDSFDQYVRVRWHMSGTQAHRLVDAASVADLLATPLGESKAAQRRAAGPQPRHEAHARALAPLKGDPRVLQEVWFTVNKEHGQEVTAEVVSQAVRARLRASEDLQDPDTREDPPEPAGGPTLTIHVGVDLDKAQAKATLQTLLDHPGPLPVGLLTIRAQIEAQLVALT